jgi:hypothetical protein
MQVAATVETRPSETLHHLAAVVAQAVTLVLLQMEHLAVLVVVLQADTRL